VCKVIEEVRNVRSFSVLRLCFSFGSLFLVLCFQKEKMYIVPQRSERTYVNERVTKKSEGVLPKERILDPVSHTQKHSYTLPRVYFYVHAYRHASRKQKNVSKERKTSTVIVGGGTGSSCLTRCVPDGTCARTRRWAAGGDAAPAGGAATPNGGRQS